MKAAYGFGDFHLNHHAMCSPCGHLILCVGLLVFFAAGAGIAFGGDPPRERISINKDWRFTKGDPAESAKTLVYEQWKAWPQQAQGKEAEALKPWILPSGNKFIQDASRWYARPEGNPGGDVPYVRPDFDDGGWKRIDLPHDWAIEGPFTSSGGGGMGRLPTAGVGWYRKRLNIPAADAGKRIFLDVDGAMSYSAVWLNGQLVGGWPFGYASFRLDLTPYVKAGGENVLAIRLDNPPNSSRWYPGAGLYRNVWLVKTAAVHVGQWGTQVTTPEVSAASATVKLSVTVDNDSDRDAIVTAATEIFLLDANGNRTGGAVGAVKPVSLKIAAHGSAAGEGTARIARPKLWGPPPQQRPNRYVAVTTVSQGKSVIDRSETPFGIRSLTFDSNKGFFINGQHVPLNGVNLHHDLGPLGAAANVRALERQLETLREMGCNAIRTSHNPPAPELLELTDRMGFLVLDEAFDVWMREKVPLDFHLVFPDWYEQDLRAFIRRDRNHPSVIFWSVGNEVSEQYSGAEGAALAAKLIDLAHQEDPTRLVAASMNWAKPNMPFPVPMEYIGLNYQGIGVRTDPPQYLPYHEKFPNKFIVSTESAAAVSSRGEYVFPVAPGYGAPAGPRNGEDLKRRQVSAYELYYADFGSSADKVFASQEKNPYVGGEFVWTGWDYLGEPTPFDQARSSYFGIVDLAGFKKERFYLYQAHWRADLPMAHILPHWTWPERVGQVTPVHVFTSGDEAELFLNGKSLGRKKKGEYEYRLRWDDVVYEPGTLSVVAYKNGKKWATDEVKTAGDPAKLTLDPDRKEIKADGLDLSFVTVAVRDKEGRTAPRAANGVHFEIEGPGEIVATDNGDPTDMEPFPSRDRKAFNGLCLVIIRGKAGQRGKITVTATAEGLEGGKASIKTVGGR
jgi:beta-galactosidase